MFRQLLLASLLFCLICPLQGKELIVETTHGRVRGLSNGLTAAFKKIPYAMPPVGLLRWQPPQDLPSWHPEVLDATQTTPGCPQIDCNPPLVCPTETSENCLFLDVFAPLGASNTSNLPVMLYIHGGNFFFMSGGSPLYDGEVFVQRGNVVLVNINYRLGALGFLVTGTGELDAKGNYGLMDQIKAMKWVKDNIRQFGGDPEKVTLFGQSAGAQSVIQHLTDPEVSSYFRAAIVESCPFVLPYKNYNEAYVLGGLLAEGLNCSISDIDCLRSRSVNDVTVVAYATRSKVASPKFLEVFEQYGPYVDGTLVKGQPLDIYSRGEMAKKPLIIGTTTEETVLYIYSAWNTSVSIAEYTEVVGIVRPLNILEILNQYPPIPTATDQREVMVKLSTDLIFECATRNATRNIIAHGQPNVWVYYWNHAMSFDAWGSDTFCVGRVCHGSEVVYVFQTAYKGNFTFTPDETVLSNNVIAYFTNFAWSGNPNTRNSSRNLQQQQHDNFRFDNNKKMKSRLSHMRIDQAGAPDTQDAIAKSHRDVFPQGSAEDKLFAAPPFWPNYQASVNWPGMFFQTPSSPVVQNRKSEGCDFWDRIGYTWLK